MASTRAVLVDAQPVVRLGLRQALEADGVDVVGEAATAVAGRDLVCSTRSDVAVVDLELPDGSGVEVIRQVRAVNARVACIVFTSLRSQDAFFQSVSAGAAGFLLKDTPPHAVVAAVRDVASGVSLITRRLLDDLVPHDPPRDEILLAGFTPRERRILGWLASGLTNREIAAELELSEKTVRNHVSTMLGKAGMRNRTQLAAAVARVRTTRKPGPPDLAATSRAGHHDRHPVVARPRRRGVAAPNRGHLPALHA